MTSRNILGCPLAHLTDAGRTIVLITHEDDVAAFAKRVIKLRHGNIMSDRVQKGRVFDVDPGPEAHAGGGTIT